MSEKPREPGVVERPTTEPVADDESKIKAKPTSAVRLPGIPPQMSTRRNLANRRRVIE